MLHSYKSYRLQPTNTNSFRTATASSNQKIFFPRKSPFEAAARPTDVITTGSGDSISAAPHCHILGRKSGPLLPTSIYKLLDELDAEEKIQQGVTRAMSLGTVMSESTCSTISGRNCKSKRIDALWVDKKSLPGRGYRL